AAEGADSPHHAGRPNMTQNGADCDVVRLMAGDPFDFSAGHSLDEPRAQEVPEVSGVVPPAHGYRIVAQNHTSALCSIESLSFTPETVTSILAVCGLGTGSHLARDDSHRPSP